MLVAAHSPRAESACSPHSPAYLNHKAFSPSPMPSFMATLLPTPPSPQPLFFSSQFSNRSSRNPYYATVVRGPLPKFLYASSSPPPTAVVEIEEDSPSAPSDGSPGEDELAIGTVENLPTRGCKACGREEIEKGCNGEGRIQGGIGAVPGFGWWPIKAYRPCPGFVASGGRYRRRGQSMDEVAFGREEKEDAIEKAQARWQYNKLTVILQTITRS